MLDLVAQLQAELDTAVLFISHNLGVISKMCDRVGVLYAGRLVEEGPVETVLQDPRHPYTVGLLRCIPRGGVRKDHGRLDTIPGLPPEPRRGAPGLRLRRPLRARRRALPRRRSRRSSAVGADTRSRCWYHERAREPAARGARGASSFRRSTARRPRSCELDELGEGLPATRPRRSGARPTSAPRSGRARRSGLVGESGSGKTTLARTLLGIVAADDRARRARGHAARRRATRSASRAELRALQIVFQNPDSALNRRHSVRRILLRSLRKLADITGAAAEQRMQDLVSRVRLTERTLTQKPVQLSGGLKQRVAIARAFAGDPKLVVCDEPTSALDVSVQAAILNLLVELQAEKRVAYLFISHDLGVVRYISDRIAVLYLGRLRSSARPTSSSTGRITRTPRRCSPPCRRSTAAGATASGSRATSRAPRPRRPAASSIRAARGSSARSARSRSRRSSRSRPATSCAATSRSRSSASCRRKEPSRDGVRMRGVRAGADRRAADCSELELADSRARRRCSSGSGRAASATPTGTRSTEPRRRAAPPCSGTRERASSRRSATASPASPSATTSRSRGRRGAGMRGVRTRPSAAVLDGVAGDGRRAGSWTERRGSRATASPSTTTRSSRRSPTPASSPSVRASRSPTTSRSTSPRSSAARCRRAPAPSGGPPAYGRATASRSSAAVASGLSALLGGRRRRRRADRRGRRGPRSNSRSHASFGATVRVEWRGSAEATAEACARHPAAVSTTRSRQPAGRRRWRPRSSPPATAEPPC